MVCYEAGDETGELELWNRRECEGCLQDSLFGMPSGFPESPFNDFSILNQSCTSDINTPVS